MPNDPMAVVRNAGLESLFAPQIIDENNNMSAGYTPSFNAQGYLIDPRAGTAANDAPAGTPYYKQGPNGDAFMLDQSGQWVDSGQPFNNVEHGFGPLAMIQELSPMIAVAAGPLFLEFGLTGMLTEALGSVGSKLAQSALVQFVTTGDISPTGLLTSAAGSAAMGALGGADSLGNLDDGISFSVLDDNLAIYGDLVGDDTAFGGAGADTFEAADAVGSPDLQPGGGLVGEQDMGAGDLSPADVGNPSPIDLGEEVTPFSTNPSTDDLGGNPTGDVASGGGILNRALDWAKENKQLATGIVTAGAGLLGGIGASMGADERLDKTIEAQKDLIKEKAAAELQALEDKRKHVQSGSYWSGKFGYKAPTGPLRRPDGSLVYAPGGGLLNRK